MRQSPIGVGLIQTDAAISPGSSGGGLFDGNGQWVGVTSFKLQEDYGTRTESLNFAVEAADIANLVSIVLDAKRFSRVLERSDLSLKRELSASFEGDVFPFWLAGVNGKAKGELRRILDAGVIAIDSGLFSPESSTDAGRQFYAGTARLVGRIAEEWKNSPEYAADYSGRTASAARIGPNEAQSVPATPKMLQFSCVGDPPGIAGHVAQFEAMIDKAMSLGRPEYAAELRNQYDSMVQRDVQAGRRTSFTVEAGSQRVISPAGWVIAQTTPEIVFRNGSSDEFTIGDDWWWRTAIGPGGQCTQD
jgi:hypothetical protein